MRTALGEGEGEGGRKEDRASPGTGEEMQQVAFAYVVTSPAV